MQSLSPARDNKYYKEVVTIPKNGENEDVAGWFLSLLMIYKLRLGKSYYKTVKPVLMKRYHYGRYNCDSTRWMQQPKAQIKGSNEEEKTALATNMVTKTSLVHQHFNNISS